MSLLSDLAALERKLTRPVNSLRDRFYSTLLTGFTSPADFNTGNSSLQTQHKHCTEKLVNGQLQHTQNLSVAATLAAVVLHENCNSYEPQHAPRKNHANSSVRLLLEHLESQQSLSKETVHRILQVFLQLQRRPNGTAPNVSPGPVFAMDVNGCIGKDYPFKLPRLEPLLATVCDELETSSTTSVEAVSHGVEEEVDVESAVDLLGTLNEEVKLQEKVLYAWEYTASLEMEMQEKCGRVGLKRRSVDEGSACAAAFRQEYLLASEKGEMWYETHALLPRDNVRVLVINRQQVLRHLMYALLGISSVLLGPAGIVNERLRLRGVGYATSQELISRMCDVVQFQRRIKSFCKGSEDSYSVRGMFDAEVCRLLDEHAFCLINSLSGEKRTLLEMTSHIDGSVRLLEQLEKLRSDIDATEKAKASASPSLEILQLLFHYAERGRVGSRHHDVIIALLKVCTRKLEAILHCLLLHGESPLSNDPNQEFVRCDSSPEVEDVNISQLYEGYTGVATKDERIGLPLELKLPNYMRSRSMNWDADMVAWRIKTCAYSLQILRKTSSALYRVCASSPSSAVSFSLFEDVSVGPSEAGSRKPPLSGFGRLREVSAAIVSELQQETDMRMSAQKKERNAMLKDNEDRLEKFHQAEMDEARRLQKSKETQLGLLKAQADEARAKKKQDRIDKIEAEKADLKAKNLQDEAAFNEAAKWLQEKYKDVDTSHLNLPWPQKTKIKAKDPLLSVHEQEKENSAEAVAENGSLRGRHRPQITILRPPGGESSLQLGTWKASPPAKRSPLEHSLSNETSLYTYTGHARKSLRKEERAHEAEVAEGEGNGGKGEEHEEKHEGDNDEGLAVLYPSTNDALNAVNVKLKAKNQTTLLSLNDTARSSLRNDRSLMCHLFNLQKVQVFTSRSAQRKVEEDTYTPPISYWLETRVVSPILDHCRLIDAAAVQLYLSQLRYLRVLAAVRDYLLLARGDLFHGFLKHIHESPNVDWHNQALIRGAWEHEKRLCMPRFSDEDELPFSFCIGVSPHASNANRHRSMVLDFIAAEFKVEWPLNSLLSDSVLEGFYKLHRYLLGLKETLIVYENVWLSMKRSTPTVGGIIKWHEIRHFLSSYECYVNTYILGELWPELVNETEKCTTSPRELKRLLKEFLTKAQRTCFLDEASTTLAECMRKLFTAVHQICSEFHDDSLRHQPNRSWVQFNRTRKFLMKALTSHSLSSPDASASRELLMRLNFNNFY